jgi:hypothetical protein
MKTPRASPEGIGGWLVLFLVIALINSLLMLLGTYIELKRPEPLVQSAAIHLTIGVLGLATYVTLVRRLKLGLILARIYLASAVIGSALIELNHKPLKMYETTLLAIVAIAWLLYLAKSVRVRNTYWPELSQSNVIKGEAITSSS